MTLIPKLTPSELERILNHLPKPNSTYISIRDGCKSADYSALKKKVQDDFPEMRRLSYLPNPRIVEFDLNFTEKSIVLDIYKTFYERMQKLEGTTEGYDPEKLRLRVEQIHWRMSKYDMEQQHKVPCEDLVTVNVTPDEIDITYPPGEQPTFVSEVLKELEETKASLKAYTYLCPHCKDC